MFGYKKDFPSAVEKHDGNFHEITIGCYARDFGHLINFEYQVEKDSVGRYVSDVQVTQVMDYRFPWYIRIWNALKYVFYPSKHITLDGIVLHISDVSILSKFLSGAVNPGLSEDKMSEDINRMGSDNG